MYQQKQCAIFLVIVLITGTIVIISPLSFNTGVNVDQWGEDTEPCFKRLLTPSQFEMLSAKLASSKEIHIELPWVDFPTIRSFEDICSELGGLDLEGLSSDVNELNSIQLPIPSNVRILVECILDVINR